jgi:UDP-glucose 4-epimerase
VAGLTGAPDEPAHAPARPGDLPAMAVDPVPAEHGLGWVPSTRLRDGVKATVEWLRDEKT